MKRITYLKMGTMAMFFGAVSFVSAANPSLFLQTPKSFVSENEEVVVSIMVDTYDLAVSATELHLSFSEGMLSFKSMKAESSLVELTKNKIEKNKISVTLGSQPTSPMKGKVKLATLVFKAIKPGKAEIGFDSTTKMAAIGKTGNILGSAKSLSIEIKPASQESKIDRDVKTSTDTSDENINASTTNQITADTKTQPGFFMKLWAKLKSLFRF